MQPNNYHGAHSHAPPPPPHPLPHGRRDDAAAPAAGSFPHVQRWSPVVANPPSGVVNTEPRSDVFSRRPEHINAPNLTTYIEHYHYYHFAGDCTVYQARDSTRAPQPHIVSHRPPSQPSPNLFHHRAPGRRIFQPSSFSGPAPSSLPQPPRHGQNRSPAEGHSFNFNLPPRTVYYAPPRDPVGYPSPAPSMPLPNTHGVIDERGHFKRERTQLTPSAKRVRVENLSTTFDAVEGHKEVEEKNGGEVRQDTQGGDGTISPSTSGSSPALMTGAGYARGDAASVVAGKQTLTDVANDWEHIVSMYMTGEGTDDGKPLRELLRGEGGENGMCEDRKLLEKRRTIGRTYEVLGKEAFEIAIGYTVGQDGFKRKQRMYQVISRCRIISAIRKQGKQLPEDPVVLSKLIDKKLEEKTAASKRRSRGQDADLSLLASLSVPKAPQDSHPSKLDENE